jgi:hypothetical protein
MVQRGHKADLEPREREDLQVELAPLENLESKASLEHPEKWEDPDRKELQACVVLLVLKVSRVNEDLLDRKDLWENQVYLAWRAVRVARERTVVPDFQVLPEPLETVDRLETCHRSLDLWDLKAPLDLVVFRECLDLMERKENRVLLENKGLQECLVNLV